MKLIWIQMAAALFQTDMMVKQKIETSKEMGKSDSYLNDRVRITRLHNYGLAGSRFVGHMPWIIASNIAAVTGCAVWFLRVLQKDGRTIQKLGLSLLTGGALSNLFDRCVRGYVVDYINFRTPFRWLNRLVFNLADFFIFIGTFLVCIGQKDHTRR